MENTTWSEEKVLSVINDYEKAMEELKVNTNNSIIDCIKFLFYRFFEVVEMHDFSKEEKDQLLKVKNNNIMIIKTVSGAEFGDAVQTIYDTTLATVPLSSAETVKKILFEKKKNYFGYDDDVTYTFSSFQKRFGPGENAQIFVKGFISFWELLGVVFSWEDKIDIGFDNSYDAQMFKIIYGNGLSDGNMEDCVVRLNSDFSEECHKYDYYFDDNLDFSQIDNVREKLKPSGVIVAGITKDIIDGKNRDVQRLLDSHMVRKVCVNDTESGWIEISAPDQYDWAIKFYSPEGNFIREIDFDKLPDFQYSLDCYKIDALEKIDEFSKIINDVPVNAFGPELQFFIPYFKRYHKNVLQDLTEKWTYHVDSKKLKAQIICQNKGFERTQVVDSFAEILSCFWEPDMSPGFSEANYELFLNAVRLLESIEDDVFQNCYPDIIGRICEKTIIPSYICQYQLIESQLDYVEESRIMIRKENAVDICYPGDDECYILSRAGWGSLLSPKMLKTKNMEVQMSFDNLDYNGASAAQFVICDAFNADFAYINSKTRKKVDVIIDLHGDVCHFEQISKTHLRSKGQYVTFVMKDKLENCHDIIEKLVKQNLLDKVISLNNRYLLFISKDKKDDKVVLAKFNHIDDERLVELYPSMIEELSLHKDSKHVRILSAAELADNNYSLSTEHYFVTEETKNVETILQTIVLRYREKHTQINILLNVLSRIGALYHRGNKHSSIQSLGVEKLDDVFDGLREFEEYLMEHYAECVDTSVRIFDSDVAFSEFSQPEMAKLMVSLQDSSSIRKLYNPFAGVASFASLLPNSIYYGNEINASIHALGSFKLDAQGLDCKGYTCEDSLQYVKSLSVKDQYDTILSIPPFMPKEEAKIYCLLFEDCMSHLEESGKMTVAVPAGFTFNQSPKMMAIRKRLIENNWVEKVIALPKGSFQGTNVSTCLIQLSKQPNHEILFCDATQMAEQHRNKIVIRTDDIVTAVKNRDADCCCRISYSDVANNHYSLNPVVYKPFPVQEGMETFKLDELLTKFRREKCSEEKGLVFTQDVLSTDVVDYRRSLSNLKIESLNHSMIKLQGDALLLSSVQSTLKPTYLEADQGICYYINRNILAFKVDTSKVMPAYLCYVLTQPSVLQQIDNYRTSAIAFVNSDDFLSVRVNLPDMNTQRNTIEELARLQYAKKKQELNKMYGDIYAEKEEEFKSLKHAMGKSVAGINAAVDNLYNYFERTGMLDTIVQTRRNTTVADKLKVIKDSIHHIEVLMQNGADFLDVSQYPLTSVSISEIWRNIHYETAKFSVNKSEVMLQSISEVSVRMNMDLFKILINDVMSNAEKHAFFDDDPANVVRVEISSDNAWLTLLISNNGEPFPRDVDVQKFTKRYWSAGKHQGSGIGGHDIQKIMKACQGEFELITDYNETFPTCYVLRFPIE